MENIFLLPTEQKSRLHYYTVGVDSGYRWVLSKEPLNWKTTHHIYITSNEVIKDVRPHVGKWQLEQGHILNKFPNYLTDLSECKLVIMTTDPILIADGVQPIDDEFLEWFIKNPKCKFVKTKDIGMRNNYPGFVYEIIIPEVNLPIPINKMSVGEKNGSLEECIKELIDKQLSDLEAVLPLDNDNIPEECFCERPDDNTCDYCDEQETIQILNDAKSKILLYKQPMMKITDTNGKDWGFKKVMSMNWDNDGKLWSVLIDFMENGNSNDFSPFYNYTGEFINQHGNLKGKIIL